MSNQFLYLDYYKRTINDKDFIVINVFEFNKKKVFKIYKPFTDNIVKSLSTFKKFDNINDLIRPGIKWNDTISLDIKL